MLATHIALPALLFSLFASFIFDADFVIDWLARHRPSASQSTLEINVARQVLATDATLRRPHASALVAVVGSSSVVNGVDVDVLNADWHARGFPYQAINIGQTGLVAYELALLRRFTLHPDIRVVVFLYNSFSFAERLLGTVVGVRWHTGEMFRLQPLEWWNPESWKRYAAGAMHEAFALVRYAPVMRSILARTLTGELSPTPYFHDFPPESDRDTRRARIPESPAPADDWLRRAYLDSVQVEDSLGYRGFTRFLQLARERGVKVIVAPVPEPEFSRFNRWRVGIDPAVVDRRTREISTTHGASYWTRARQVSLESDDSLFRDQTHFNRFGRDEYSRMLSTWIEDAITH